MEREFNTESLYPIYRMLLEMAKGNFSVQLEQTHNNDELEGLTLLLNMTAQKLNKKRNQFLWINKDRELVVIQTTSFLLDSNFKILNCHSEIQDFKRHPKISLPVGESFQNILSLESKALWKRTISELRKRNFTILPLQYAIDNKIHHELHSVILKITCENSINYTVHASLINVKRSDLIDRSEINELHKPAIWDQQLFQEIQDYITNHLQEPLISNLELAARFNTNEQKVKRGFKEFFGHTPFQFHRNERIEQSKTLIANTDLSLNQIALEMGFSSYPHFSKTFKTITEMTPRSFKKLFRD